MGKRVIISACSGLTPIGHGKQQILKSLENGISGVKPLRDDGLLSDHIHSKVFGTIDYPVEFNFKRTQRKTMGPVAFDACQVV